MNADRPDFPLVWDNSMRDALVACPMKFFRSYVEHYKSRYLSVDLHAGKAFASGLEAARKAFYVDGISEPESEALGLQTLFRDYGDFECPPHSPKTRGRMIEAFIYYFMVFPMSLDPAQPYVGKNGPMIEFSFALPLDDNLHHPVTGEPLIYAGRADMVADYANAITIYDDKTTTSLGPTWGAKWDMRAQFTGYTWAAQSYGIPVSQVLVRGISILKTKLDHANAISNRDEFRVDRWHAQVVRDIRRAMRMWEENHWDIAESDACESFGGCAFKQPCQTADPEPWLDLYFEKRKWDPVTRTEGLLGNRIVPLSAIGEPVYGNVYDYIKGQKR